MIESGRRKKKRNRKMSEKEDVGSGSETKKVLNSDKGMVGCVAKIYNSVQSMDASYMYKKQDKNKLLLQLTSMRYPLASTASSHLFLGYKHERTTATQQYYYQCQAINRNSDYYNTQFPQCGFSYVSDVCSTECPECRKPMTKELTFVKGVKSSEDKHPIGKGGIVKGVVSYMIMDDLSISPLSMISAIGILNMFNVVIRDVEERTVEIDMEKGLKLLKACLYSKTVLSDVFLLPKKEDGDSSTRQKPEPGSALFTPIEELNY